LEDGTLKLFDVKQDLQELYSSKIHDSSITRIVFENKPKEINSNFALVMKNASEIDVKDCENVICSTVDSSATITKRSKCSKSVRLMDHKEEGLEAVKRSLCKMVKSEMESLESQLQEHCVKYQKFLDNEFETIDQIIKKKWDIFNIGDMNQIVKSICPEKGSQ